MEEKKVKVSLRHRLVMMIVLMGIVLTAAAITVSYRVFSNTMTDYYGIHGSSITAAAASQLEPEILDRYFETLEPDKEYYEIQEFIRDMANASDVKYLYVVRPHGIGVTFLFDSDEQETESGSYNEGGYCTLGSYVDLVGAFAENLEGLLAGEEIDPIVQKDESYGWQMTTMTPILHGDGTICAYVMADIDVNDIMQTRMNFLWMLLALLGVLTIIFIVLFVSILRRMIVQPIGVLTEAAGAFISNNREELADGVATVNIPEIRSGDELEMLADSVRQMEGDMISYLRSLMQATAEKERIGAELHVATRIQADMLPRVFPAFPDREEFDIYASMNPAKEVGGDFYDFFPVDDDHLAIVIADVSGKGVPAALFMVIAKTLIKNHAQHGEAPHDVFTTVNEQLCEGNDAGLFVTAWMGVLKLSTGDFTFVNAGHNPPLLRRAGGQYEWLKSRPGFVLAGLEGTRYRENLIKLNPGDKLYLYTDGVTEATNAEQELFGEPRLLEKLNESPDLPVSLLLGKIRCDIDDFVGEAEQFDDITMLGLEYRGGKALPTTVEKAFPAELEQLEPVQNFIGDYLEKAGCTNKVRFQVDVAVEEIFVNIAHYAYGEGTGDAIVRVALDNENSETEITFIDSGVPFNPLSVPDADTTLSADERRIGGLGILMVKKTMDHVAYRFENGRNILSIRKKLQ